MRAFGAALSLTHVWTYLFWCGFGLPFADHLTRNFLILMRPGGTSICWPSSEICGWLGHFASGSVSIILGAYLMLALAACYGFLKTDRIGAAYAISIALFVFKFVILVSTSYRMANYHYMVFFVLFGFLFLPRKKEICALMVLVFYVSAGALKLNQEWLSGAALLTAPPLWIPPSLLSGLLFMAPIFELILVFGLFSRKPVVHWLAYCLTVLFHVVSWQQVGFFYPLIMLSLTSIFPLSYIFEDRLVEFSAYRVPCAHIVILFFLIGGQIYPKMLPGDSALTGQARFLSLSMFDAIPECFSQGLIQRKDGETIEISDSADDYRARVRCDPLRFYNWAHRTCVEQKLSDPAVDLDFSVIAKRRTDDLFQPTVTLRKFCSDPQSFHFWTNNDWIHSWSH